MIIKVFIVDDEEKTRKLVASKIRNLKDKDFQLIGEAANGMEALNKISHEVPNIIITDIKMPIMDGLKLSQLLYKKYSDIFIIILSGFDEFEFARQAMKYGVTEYLLKPIDDIKFNKAILDIRDEIIAKNISSKLVSSKVTISSEFENLTYKNYGLICIMIGNKEIQYNCNLSKIYLDIVGNIDWKEVFFETNSDIRNFFVVSDIFINQYYIVFDKNKKLDIEAVSRTIIKYLSIKIKIPIFIIYSCNDLQPENIYAIEKVVRLSFKKTIIYDKSNIYNINNLISMNDYQNQINTFQYFIEKDLLLYNFDKLKEDINNYLVFRISNNISSFNLENLVKEIYDFILNVKGMPKKELPECFYENFIFTSNVEKITDIIISEAQLNKVTQNRQNKTITQLIDYVNDNFCSINLENLSLKFNYNYSYISRYFKETTGQNITNYIIKKRIEYAKKIIEDCSTISINDVSKKVGYYDYHYFSRMFKTITGITPSEYKNKYWEMKK